MEKSPHTDAFPKGVSQPAIRALEDAGYSRLDQLAGASESELAKLHGMGPKAIRVIRQALIDQKLTPLKQ
jgi:predicted flap endonuclease-1-like 5' DNA nuclease